MIHTPASAFLSYSTSSGSKYSKVQQRRCTAAASLRGRGSWRPDSTDDFEAGLPVAVAPQLGRLRRRRVASTSLEITTGGSRTAAPGAAVATWVKTGENPAAARRAGGKRGGMQGPLYGCGPPASRKAALCLAPPHKQGVSLRGKPARFGSSTRCPREKDSGDLGRADVSTTALYLHSFRSAQEGSCKPTSHRMGTFPV